VNGIAGTITIPSPNRARTAYLNDVSALDVNMMFRVQTDKPAVGGGQLVYALARQVTPGTAYLIRLRLSTDGSVRLQAIQELNGQSRLLGAEKVVSEVRHVAEGALWVRGQVVGINPTTIRIKAWAEGQAEPQAWHYSITDVTPSLQAAGAVGLRAYVAPTATNAPVRFSFDDLRVTSITSVAEPHDYVGESGWS
jgi:hypothetical protein